jgi:predicted dehydrogenase
MPNKVRVGIVGTSQFAEKMHYAPLASHPAAEIAALCGRSRERAEELAARFQVPQVFTSWQEMIERAGVDAVVVVTPDDLHYPITMAALRAGKHVFCEKTLAMNAAQAREMYETAEAQGLVHMTLFTWRWQPAVLYMLDLMQQGYLGPVFHAQFNYLISFGRVTHYRWRSDSNHSGGMLADLGSHMIDLSRLLLGDVRRVACRAQMYMDPEGPGDQPMQANNDSAVLLCEYASGAQVTMQLSSVAHLGADFSHVSVQLYGANGSLLLESNSAGTTITGASGPGGAMQPLPVPAQYENDYLESPIGERLFIDSIRSGQKPVPSFYEGWKAQQVIDAAVEANQTGCWVDITD